MVQAMADVQEIPRVRHWVVDRARACGAPEPVLGTVALLATEAVTNAVRHGPAGAPIDVDVRRGEGAVRVAVTDRSHAPPVLMHVGPTAPGGRGVMLIDRLAERWGVDPEPDGKTVWFEVAV